MAQNYCELFFETLYSFIKKVKIFILSFFREYSWKKSLILPPHYQTYFALRTMQIFMFNLQLLVVLYFSLWFECDNQMSTAFHCFHSQTIVANITQPKAALSTVKIFSVYDSTPPNIHVQFTAIGCIMFFTVVWMW